MNIAVTSNTSFNIYNFRLGLIKFLISKGYQVIFIAPYDDYVELILKEVQIKYIELNHLSRKGNNPIQELQLIREYYNAFKAEQIDVSLSYTIKPNIYSAIAGYFTNTKTILNITGLGYVFLKNSLGNILAKFLLRVSSQLASKVVFQNQTDKSLFENRKIVNPNKTLLINGSGINTEKYKPESSSGSTNQFSFLFVGRLLYDKGIREFIEASQIIHNSNPSVQFHIVGDLDTGNPSAVSENNLEIWLASNTQLKYHGHQRNVIPFIQNCDVVVLPSYREGIPRVLLESMALEKPFITSDSPGCNDVTTNGINGLLVKTGSAQDLEQKMSYLLNSSHEKRLEMGKNGRKIVLEKYDEKVIVEEYLKLLLTLT